MILNNFKLRTRLNIAFGVLILLTFSVGITAVLQFGKLEKNTSDIYNHPYTISNSVREIKINVNSMYILLNEFLQKKDTALLEETITTLNKYDDKTLELFFIVFARFSGDQRDVQATYQAYLEWIVTCNRVIESARTGNINEAATIFKLGKPQLSQLNADMSKMIEFATTKGEEFYKNIQTLEKKAFFILTIHVTTVIAIGLIIIFLLARSITVPIKKITNKIKGISKQHIKYNLEIKGHSELQLLELSVDHLEKVSILLKEEIEERMSSEEMIRKQFEEIQSYSEQLQSAKNELEERVIDRTKKLRESEEKFRTLIKILPVGVYLTNLEGKYEYVNEKWTEMTGLSNEQAIGDEWTKALHPDDKDAVSSAWNNMVETSGSFKMGYRFLKNGNKTIWVMSVAKNYYVDEKIAGYIGAAMDITNLKEAEAALQKEHDFNLNLMETSPTGIIVYDKNGIITYLNPIAEKILSLDKDKLLNQSISSINITMTDLNGHAFPESKSPFYLALSSGNPVYNEEVIIHTQKHQTYIFVNAAPLFDRSNAISGVIAIIEDITKRTETEKELIKAKEKAEESDRLKSSFLANMSHEIRTPMNGIVGFASLLRDPGKTPEMQQKYIDIIWKSTIQLLTIITDILDISKIEIGQVETLKTEISLNFLLDDLYSTYNSEIITVKKTIELRLKKGCKDGEDWFYTDGQRLKQIFTNLLSNGVKFTNKGYIEFGYQAKNSHIEFYVKDTGIGIPEHKHKSIFDRFRQGDETATRKYGGTGLGLSIVKGCVKILDGDMHLQSKEGEGSTFIFTLPGKLITKEESNIDENDKPFINLKEGTILIVEDDDTSYQYLKEVLTSLCNIKIIHTEKGFEAISICKTNQDIQLVLMDIRLPDLDGYKTTEAIKSIRKNLPVIAQTANATTEDRAKSVAAGCNEFIEKPISKEKLLKLIDKFIKA